jgi:O-antigen ligase
MNEMNRPTETTRIDGVFVALLALAFVGLTVFVSYSIGRGSSLWQQVLIGLVGLVVVGLILRRPHWGLAFVIAFVGITELLPSSTIAQLTNYALGGATAVAFFLQRKWGVVKAPPLIFTRIHLFSILFLFWCLITNPSAAVGLTTDRNWIFTFVQLFLLQWLSSQILTTPEKHRVVMVVFIVAALFSTISAIQEALAGDSIYQLIRAGGLAGGSNTATRLFTIAIIFLYGLRSTVKNRAGSILVLLCIIVFGYGVVSTLSRTGIILLGITFVLLLIADTVGKAETQLRRQRPLMIVAAFLLIFILLPTQFLDDLWGRFTESADVTSELRYWLWKAGIEMFQDHPIQGVGIGRFSYELPVYGFYYLESQYLNLGAHNIYIDILAETGIVGSILYGGMLISSLLAYWRASRWSPPAQAAIARTWLIVLVVILLGGLTKQDQYDKLLWMSLGVGACFVVPTTKPTHPNKQLRFAGSPARQEVI